MPESWHFLLQSPNSLFIRKQEGFPSLKSIQRTTNLISKVSMTHYLRFLTSFRTTPLKLPLIAKHRHFHSSFLRPRSELSFTVGTYAIPHPAKAGGGEDAFFVSSHNGGVLAIADGVSGWAERGVNPALFPRELMANASSFVVDEEVNFDPQMLLKKAHAATSSIGSATVILAMLEKNGILNIVNVGDCGLRIFRKGQMIFCTRPQEHYFDCPYQLSSEKSGQTYRDAMVLNNDYKKLCSVKVLEGDTIIMGSDGLFDNVFDHEIATIISSFQDVAEAAKRIADVASTHSTDVNFDSPYALEARNKGFDVPFWRKILGKKLTGGKPDDITVIVGHVLCS